MARFLFVQERIEGRLVLNQPAGHLDPGESLVAACRREVLEETAHRFRPTGLVGIYRWHYDAQGRDVSAVLLQGTLEGTAVAAARQGDRRSAVAHARGGVEHRRAEHRSPLVEKCVDDFLAGRNFPLDVLSAEFA